MIEEFAIFIVDKGFGSSFVSANWTKMQRIYINMTQIWGFPHRSDIAMWIYMIVVWLNGWLSLHLSNIPVPPASWLCNDHSIECTIANKPLSSTQTYGVHHTAGWCKKRVIWRTAKIKRSTKCVEIVVYLLVVTPFNLNRARAKKNKQTKFAWWFNALEIELFALWLTSTENTERLRTGGIHEQ